MCINVCVISLRPLYPLDDDGVIEREGERSIKEGRDQKQRGGELLRPKTHGYTRFKRREWVKPGSVKLAMGNLLHGEACNGQSTTW